MRKLLIPLSLIAALGTAACTNPNDPMQRAAGGGLIGAGAGAGLGAIAGGGQGALIGAVAGGAVGAATGVITTPQPQQRRY